LAIRDRRLVDDFWGTRLLKDGGSKLALGSFFGLVSRTKPSAFLIELKSIL